MPDSQPAGGITSLAQGSFVDTVFSADGSLLYAATANGVQVINVATGQVINTFIATVPTGGIDISPDGLYLAVVDTRANSSGVLYRIRLSDGNTVGYAVSGTQALNDVAFLSDGSMVVSQQTAAALHVFNPDNGNSYDIGNILPAYSVLTENADVVLAQPHTITWPLYTLNFGTGFSSYLATNDPYAGASVSPPDQAVGAVSPTGNLIVQGSSLRVYDSSLNYITSLADEFPYLRWSYGLKFSADGKTLYVATRDGQIVQFDTATWDVTASYSIGANPANPGNQPGPTVGYGNVLQLSPDGHHLSVITPNGIQLIDLSLSVPTATSGADTLSGPGPLYGFGGNDDLTGTGSTWMYGGNGNDTYHITSTGNQVFEYGDQGEDTVHSTISYGLSESVEHLFLDGSASIDGWGNDLNNSIFGNASANKLSGGNGNDNLQAGSGDDTLNGGSGDDVLDGGAGTDTVTYQDFGAGTQWNGVTVSLAIDGPQNTGPLGKDTLISIENLTGSFNNDHLTGNSGANTILGMAGGDFISGGLGADTLAGGDGYDTFIDTAAGLNGDTITDFGAGDKIVITDASLGSFTFSLSNGVLTYSGGTLNVGTAVPGFAVSAAAQGGVQLTLLPAGAVSTDTIAAQLTSGYWDGEVRHFAVTQGGTITVNIATLTPDAQFLARTALATWSDIIGVDFQEVSEGQQITFSDDEEPDGPIAYTYSITSGGIITESNVKITNSWLLGHGTSLQSDGFETYVHEIGHALGLGHAGNYNFTGNYPTDALFVNDGLPLSVMSYFDQQENTYFWHLDFTQHDISTPMQADILAMQTLYGLSTTTRFGDTIYGYHSNAGALYDASIAVGAFTIYDSGGKDTLDYSGYYGFQQIDLNAESFSSVGGLRNNISIARGVTIENGIGGSGFDIIIGNAAANVITGGQGADTLTGGAGSDTFRDTAANHNGDTITDFTKGDRIVITDATLSTFTFSVSGNTLVYTGGALTLGSSVSEIFASAAQGGGVQLTLFQAAPPDPANDFNGDGYSDVLWRSDAGAVVTFHGQSNGSFAGNVNFNLNPGLDWHVVGIGDFNGDGNDDILWRNDAGAVVDLLGQDNGAFIGNVSFNLNPGLDWHIEGTGDFNGDGFDDILWRNDIGKVVTLLGEAGGSFIGNVSFNLNPGLDWHVVGTGDFNGDGYDDILWRNDIGKVVTLLGEAGGSFIGNVNFDLNPGLDWHVVGTGDFNGDGYDDILWRSDSGVITDLLGTSNGAFIGNAANLSVNPGLDWQVASIGDFNGDGIDDLMLRNGDGRAIDWLGQPNGGFNDNSGVFSVNPGVEWHVQPSLGTFG